MTTTTAPFHREPTEKELAVIRDMCAELDGRFGPDGGDPRVNAPPRPCFALGSLVCGGASVSTLRWVWRLPPWVREKSVVWARDCSPPGARDLRGFNVVYTPPVDPTHWLLSAVQTDASFRPPPARTTVLLHTADRQYTRGLYAALRGVGVMAVSASALEVHAPWIVEQGHEVLGVLPPVYPALFPPSVRGVSGVRAVFVGRPSAAKGFHLLPRLLKLMPDLVVTVYAGGDQGLGATPEETAAVHRTRQVAERMHVADRFVVGAYCDALDDYHSMYAGQDVLLLLSVSESQPLVVGEALSCGVPVVATAVGGVAEVVGGEAGVLVPSPDVSGWSLNVVVDAIGAARHILADVCQAAVVRLCGRTWDQAYRPLLLRRLGADLPQAPNARVTVKVCVPKDPDLGWLDACMASVAGQTYRRAWTVIACDDETTREDLALRYEVPATPMGMRHVWTEYVAEVPYGLRLCKGYLEQQVQVMDALQRPAIVSLSTILDEDAEPEVAGQSTWAPASGVLFSRVVSWTGATHNEALVNDRNSLVAGRRIA